MLNVSNAARVGSVCTGETVVPSAELDSDTPAFHVDVENIHTHGVCIHMNLFQADTVVIQDDHALAV